MLDKASNSRFQSLKDETSHTTNQAEVGERGAVDNQDPALTGPWILPTNPKGTDDQGKDMLLELGRQLQATANDNESTEGSKDELLKKQE